jgi:superkiller protein 3
MALWNAKVKDAPAAAETGARAAVVGERRGGARPGQPGAGGADNSLKAQLDEARDMMKEQRFDEALAAYETILEKNPDAAQAYIGVGNIHARRGAYDEALEYYDGALHIRKDLPPALLMSGNAYLKKGMEDKALERFQQAVEVNPGMTQARLSMSRIYSKQGKTKDAIACLREALEYNPQLESAQLALAGIYQKEGNTEAALKEIEAVIARDPESAQGQFRYAAILAEKKDYERAIAAGRKAVAAKAESAPAHQLLGRCYLETGEHELASKAFAQASELDPTSMVAKLGTVQVKIAMNRLDEAKRILVELANGTRNLGMVHRTLGEVLMKQESWAAAAAEFRAAVLHSKRLVEKHPELKEIKLNPDEPRAAAEAYAQAFAQIDRAGATAVDGDSDT